MKIVNITGSPRKKGTSIRIANSFIDSLKDKGVEINTYHLNQMNFKGCQGCDICKQKSETCIQKDDLSIVLSDILNADIAVFSSPVYYGDVTGQFKSFFDRTWSFVGADYRSSRVPSGKKAVLILTQADVESVHLDVVDRYTKFLTSYGFEIEIIRATGCGMEKNADVSYEITKASEIAQKIGL
ncbi:MAG: flavodoxin family protein [Deltaproteobacteria bacterium]|nr:flavodoxin family protein [Deltaproteobacteria bacterium]